MKTYRFGSREKIERLRPTLKKVTNLYDKVKERVLFLKDCDMKAFEKETNYSRRILTKEEFATKFQVKTHEIETCFQKLNKEGILSQAKKRTVHDTTRDYWSGGPMSGWASNYYVFIEDHKKWFNAIWYENKKKIEQMLENGYDINARTENNSTLTAIHINENAVNMIAYLLKLGAKPNREDLLDYLKYNEIFLLLLERASVALEPILIAGVSQSDPSLIESILDKGTKIDFQNEEGNTALMIATETNRMDTVSILLKKGAKISVKNKNGLTALDIALKNKNRDILKLFLDYEKRFTKKQQKDMIPTRMRLLFQ